MLVAPQGRLVAPGESARFWKITPLRDVVAGHAAFRYASLHATCDMNSKNRVRKVQGGIRSRPAKLTQHLPSLATIISCLKHMLEARIDRKIE